MTMGVGAFRTKINSSTNLLRKCDLLLKENKYPKPSSSIVSILRKETYPGTWRHLIEESCFNTLLRDYGVFLFSIYDSGSSENLISMSYYGNPYEFMTIEDYIVEQHGEEYLLFQDDPSMVEEYQQSLVNSPRLESPVTFRYDFSPGQYDSGRHPASHIHVGFSNQIRLGCEKILNPISFVAFVLRQQYPEVWKSRVLKSHVNICKHSIRDSLPSVPSSFLCNDDRLEMYLG